MGDYVAAAQYTGLRPGFTFQSGARGVGYYAEDAVSLYEAVAMAAARLRLITQGLAVNEAALHAAQTVLDRVAGDTARSRTAQQTADSEFRALTASMLAYPKGSIKRPP